MYYNPSVFPRHDMLYEASGVISNQSGRDYDVASSPYLSILAPAVVYLPPHFQMIISEPF